jgi:hypothetical protein
MPYAIHIMGRGGVSYATTNDKKKNLVSSKNREDAKIFASKKPAEAFADFLNKNYSGLSAYAEKVWWTLPKKAHRKNPAPSPASRSAKFHRMRASLLTKLQIAKRKGSFVMEQLIGQKLRKLDRMFYAPRNVKRRK